MLSEERRKELVKICSKLVEEGRVAVRQARTDAMARIKKTEKVPEDEKTRAEKDVQKHTDEAHPADRRAVEGQGSRNPRGVTMSDDFTPPDAAAPQRRGPAPHRDHHGRQRSLGRRSADCRAAPATRPAWRRCAKRSKACLQAGVDVLTLFAFSQENWQRPAAEIDALMALLEEYIAREVAELREQGVAVRMLGDLDRLTPSARDAVDQHRVADRRRRARSRSTSASRTARAPSWSAPPACSPSASRPASSTPPRSTRRRSAAELYTAAWPDPDLLIRTSGEMRVSNFLLWQLAYAEFHVTPVLWPDFTREDLFEAILDYQNRDRRFGRVSA